MRLTAFFSPFVLVAVGLFLPVGIASSFSNWPEFRGPNRDGTVNEELPVQWSEDSGVKWKSEIPGKGWSTPAIYGNQVWLTTATEDGREMSVLCLDQESGKILHQQLLVTNDNPEPLSNPVNSYASPSPVIEEGRVYVGFGSYGTFCLDTESFETIWSRRDLTVSHWRGPASSLALWNGKVILTLEGADQQYHVALDTADGKTLWRRDRSTVFGDTNPDNDRPANSGDMRKSFSTPIFIEVDGTTQMISPGAKACWAYDPETGDELWQVSYATHSPSSRPVFSKELGLIFINTGLGKAEVWAVRADAEATGDVSGSHVVWKQIKRTPKRSSPVLVKDLLFWANDGVVTCVDAKTGEPHWQERAGAEYSASLVTDGTHVYFFDEEGLGTVTRASPEFEVVAENHLETGLMASPAASGGDFFLRTKTHLYRIGR